MSFLIRNSWRAAHWKKRARSWNGLCLLLAFSSLGCLAAWLWFNESEGMNLAFAFATTGLLVGVLAFASRRLLFAAAAAGAITAAIIVVARLKRAVEGMVLHAWDFIGTLLSWNELAAAIGEYPREWTWGALTGLVAVASLTAIWRFERPLVRRGYAACFSALCVGAVAYTGPRLPERGHTQFFWDGVYVSGFWRSFGETAEAVWRGGLFERGVVAPPFTPQTSCKPENPPHILLIHEESVTPPSGFPGLLYDQALDDFFRSGDGASRRLRVETYGGASWLTQFSVLAGVSAQAFGSMSAFVQPFMRGRLAETVPQTLATCGYRNLMFTAWPKQFMGVARFYESIGVREIFDQKAQGNTRENERDRFFFANALAQIERHVAASRAPLFVFIETMSAHWSYDVTYEPDVKAPGAAPGAHPEVHEYLRRLAIVKMDDDWLKAELARRFPGEAFLIVRYGDHHPLATRSLLGLPDEIEVQDIRLPHDSPGFLTFYAVDGIGYQPPPSPDIEPVDAAYLGAILLEAARLPLPPSWRARLELMNACGGRYWTCTDRDRVLTFQSRLVEGGLMRPR